MSLVRIDASPKQLSKLRNGHNVRIKPAMEGEGFNLMIDPIKYRSVMKSFQKNKGIQIQLSPEEILANRQLSPEYHQNVKKEDMKMSGKGIFGKTFDKFVEKTIGKKAKDVLYKGADSLKPSIKAGIDKIAQYAPEASASALSALALATGQPELVPVALLAGNELGKYIGRAGANTAKDYLDNPSKYQENISGFTSNIGGSRANSASSLAGQVSQNEILSILNRQLGTNMGSRSRAAMASAMANRQGAEMMPTPMQPEPFGMRNRMPAGFRNVMGTGMKKSIGIVGTLGSQLNRQANQPPALQSQASGANFQFASTLPPTYQKYHKGMGSGSMVGTSFKA